MPVRILVVDDEPDLGLLLRQKFKKQIRAGEWAFSYAGNGVEALDLLERDVEVDVVLTDINMPHMDGLTLLTRLEELGLPLKAVVVSAYGDMANIRTAMNRGAFDFVTKPIHMADLTRTIEKTWEAVQAQRAAERTREELAVLSNELEISRQIEDLKSRFFADLSHEFRTPLTLILGPLEDVLAGDYGSSGALPEAAVRVMHTQARRLKRLIDQLLDLSKLEAGRMMLRARPADVVAFLRALTLSFAAEAERRGVSLRFESQEDALELYFEPDKLEKIVANLLSNALKFTPEGGRVRVRVSAPGEQAVAIEVRDSGRGVHERELPRLFERFHRVQEGGANLQEGTGIGLALVKELVELHGGTVVVESEPGFGTCFTVRLPRGRDHLAPEELVEAEDSVSVPAEELWMLAEPDELYEAEEPAEKTATVLLVEDNADVRAYVRMHLARRYRVIEAEDGTEGLELARTEGPDLVVSDVMMPGMDGYELCRRLKADEECSHIPVLLLTARTEEKDRLEGLETGADDYITKPFNARELLLRAENLIEVRRLLRERFSGEVVIQGSQVSVPSADAAFLEQVRDVIETKMGERDFEVACVADEVGLSPRQLRRKLRDLTGLSPSGYVRTLRLQRAAQLLEQQAGGVSEVAYEVGFMDAKYFSRLFRQVYGVLPSEYGGASGQAG